MTIYVQWKWQEDTETFLIIFHFDADFVGENLRIASRAFLNTKNTPTDDQRYKKRYYYFDANLVGGLQSYPLSQKIGDVSKVKVRNVITWSPSHVDVALLMDVLGLSNIINGFKKQRLRTLRTRLEFWVKKEDRHMPSSSMENNTLVESGKATAKLRNMLGEERKYLVGFPDKPGVNQGLEYSCELCPEYINYLKDVIKETTAN
ncbi:MAG: hypothetical protein ABSA79_00150 [Candidatus Bathyarchaeia archaeon]|jgi:hypothetical protein